MRVAVAGTGYVGLVSGACFAEMGHEVICVDVDPERVARVNSGDAPFHEPGLSELLRAHVGRRLRATERLPEAVEASEVTFVAVETPFAHGAIDLSAVKSVARQIGAVLRARTAYHVVAVKSTVVPGTTAGVVLPILEGASGRRAGPDFGVGANPEFLTEGQAVADFLRPDRVVLGGIDARTWEVLEAVHGGAGGAPVVRTNPATAEMIKYASNCLLATAISLSNEIANLGTALGGIDAAEVMRGVQLSRYLTSVTASGERVPAGLSPYLYAGCGFGGSCLGKDTRALAALGRRAGSPTPLLDAVVEINEAQPSRMLDILRRHFPTLRGLRTAVLGLAFKPDTDDMRDSPAIPIVRALLAEGASVNAYDPVARDSARATFHGQPVHLRDSLESALERVDAALLVTRWEEFRRLPSLLRGMRPVPLLVDGRRMLDRESVPRYDGIGL